MGSGWLGSVVMSRDYSRSCDLIASGCSVNILLQLVLFGFVLRSLSVPTANTLKPRDSVRLYLNPMRVDAIGLELLKRALMLAQH